MFSVVQYPSGKWGFVGKVPAVVAFESSSPKYEEVAKQCGPGFAKKIAEREGGVFKTCVWETKEEAVAAAEAAGFKVGE